MNNEEKQALIEDCQRDISELERDIAHIARCDAIGAADYLFYLQSKLKRQQIALAALEADPVGEFYECEPGNWYQRSPGDKAPKWTPLYVNPPVPKP